MSDQNTVLSSLKDFLWPSDPKEKAVRKTHYKSIGIFIVATAVLSKFGREISDLIYNQAMLEETIRSSGL